PSASVGLRTRHAATRHPAAAQFAGGIEPYLTHDAPVVLEAALNYDVDEQMQQAADITACEGAAARALLDQQHELLEGELGAGRMHAGDRARMPGVDVAQVVERLLGAQLCEQDAVRAHPQAALEQLPRRDAREALIVLAIEQAHVIGVLSEYQLARVLDGHEPLVTCNLADQRLGPCGLAGAGRARQ